MKDRGRPANQLVRRILEFRDSGTVLDVGAGYGRHSLFLAEHGFDVTAIEPAGLDRLKAKVELAGARIQMAISDLESFKTATTYNIVIATMVLHFLPDRTAVYRGIDKLKSLTSAGGLNVVSVMLDKEVNNPRPYLFAEGELRDAYDGWRILHYDEELSLPYFPLNSDTEICSFGARLIAEKPGSE